MMEALLCTYCQNAITTCRVQCSECEKFDLCLQCFACGVESGSHKKEHDYKVVDIGLFNVFGRDDTWTAKEDEALLDAVEQYGFGSWDDVGRTVQSKSPDECKEHYYAFYIYGNVGKATYKSEYKKKVRDYTGPDFGPLSPSITTPIAPVDLQPQEARELGYMPLRDDFERECDNEAETLVSSLSLNYDDEDIDTAFKIAQVDMYRVRLKERQHRKDIAREYGLIQQASSSGVKKAIQDKKKYTKDQKDLKDKMRAFARFHTASEHKAFFDSLLREKRIKSRIKELMKYRKNGITKIDDASKYDKEKGSREKRKENKRKGISNTALHRRIPTVSSKREKDAKDIIFIANDKESSGAQKKESSQAPGYKLLSLREKKLCKSIGLLPATYITIKTCIIKDYLQRRQGHSVKVRYPSHLDKTHRRKILNFLQENGWIGNIGCA